MRSLIHTCGLPACPRQNCNQQVDYGCTDRQTDRQIDRETDMQADSKAFVERYDGSGQVMSGWSTPIHTHRGWVSAITTYVTTHPIP
mmetsp:Transcript_10367/g.25082  ORF Transcript_10367/g.25082 Transcript_10367/m.25082 type:complete len:87 (-) Transcript_10367:96-356(-)